MITGLLNAWIKNKETISLVEISLNLSMKILRKRSKCPSITNTHMLTGRIAHSKDSWKLAEPQLQPDRHNSKSLVEYFSGNPKRKMKRNKKLTKNFDVCLSLIKFILFQHKLKLNYNQIWLWTLKYDWIMPMLDRI